MKLSPALKFNIIFVPGTVRILRLAVFSILDNSDCCFRLVSNGCGEDEARLLREWCRDNPRLEFFDASQIHGSRTNASPARVIPHGDLLTRLQRDERSPLFALMDSDIFASGVFLDELAPVLEANDAVFSCWPIYCNDLSQTMPPDCRIMHGEINKLSDGTCVGGTYFAIYDNSVLTRLMQETGLTMRRYVWEEIPPSVQDELRQSNKVLNIYDTGKLLNILLTLRGFSTRLAKLNNLCHIGGMSSVALLSRYSRIRGGLSMILPATILKMLRWMKMYNGPFDKSSREERRFIGKMSLRLRTTSEYMTAYLNFLELGTRQPSPFRHKDSQLVARVHETERLLDELYRRYSEDPCLVLSAECKTNNMLVETELPNWAE